MSEKSRENYVDEVKEAGIVTGESADSRYQDDSVSPKKSPLTVSTAEIAIKVPAKAVSFVYQARDAAIRITTTSEFGSGYITVLQGNGDTLDCRDTSYIYVKRDAGTDAALHFYFKTY